MFAGLPSRVTSNIVKIFENMELYLRINENETNFSFTSLGLLQGDILFPIIYFVHTATLERMISALEYFTIHR